MKIKSIIKQYDPFAMAILLAALVFRLFFWKTLRFMIDFDEANYLRMAGQMGVVGIRAVLHPYWAPGFPFVVGCLDSLFRDPEFTARLINILSGTMVVLLVYLWTKRIFNRSVARAAVALAAFWPEIAFANTDAMPEALYTILGLGGLYLMTKTLEKYSARASLLSGFCFAGAYLIKPEGIGFIAIVLMLFAVRIFRNGFNRRLGNNIMHPALLLFVFVMMSLPYWIYLNKVTGRWTVSSKGYVNQQMESAVYYNDGPVKDPFFHLTSDYQLPYDMAMHFGNLSELHHSTEGRARVENIPISRYLNKYARNLHEIVQKSIPEMLGSILFILIILGFFSTPPPRDKILLILPVLLTVGFFWLIVVPMFHVNLRYFRPLLPLLFIWAGRGVFVLEDWICGTLSLWRMNAGLQKTLSGLLIALFLGLGYFTEMGRVLQRRHVTAEIWDQAVELKEAALWLKSKVTEPPRLMTLNKAVDFYAGQMDRTAGASFSYDSVPMNVAYAKRRDVDYLVFSGRYIPWFENLAPLISEEHHEGIERIYHRKSADNLETVIYKVIK